MARVVTSPGTPTHSVRVAPALWNAARKRAEQNGETIADVIRRALERYVR